MPQKILWVKVPARIMSVSIYISCWGKKIVRSLSHDTDRNTKGLAIWKAPYPAVPARSVDIWVSSRDDVLEMPKSATFAVNESSSKMLAGFTSLWMTGGSCIPKIIILRQKFRVDVPELFGIAIKHVRCHALLMWNWSHRLRVWAYRMRVKVIQGSCDPHCNL